MCSLLFTVNDDYIVIYACIFFLSFLFERGRGTVSCAYTELLGFSVSYMVKSCTWTNILYHSPNEKSADYKLLLRLQRT
jgi:hypothetical protein